MQISGGQTLSEDKLSIYKQYPVDELTHDIRDYLPLLHRTNHKNRSPEVRADQIKILRKLARKL